MTTERKRNTIIFATVICVLAIITDIISKTLMFSYETIPVIALFTFIYIRYYPKDDIKKESLLNKLALVFGIIYIIALSLAVIIHAIARYYY